MMGASCRSGNSLEENVAFAVGVAAHVVAPPVAGECGCDDKRGAGSIDCDCAAKYRIIPQWERASNELRVELTRRAAALATMVDLEFSIIVVDSSKYLS
jgi:hypothetical protein